MTTNTENSIQPTCPPSALEGASAPNYRDLFPMDLSKEFRFPAPSRCLLVDRKLQSRSSIKQRKYARRGSRTPRMLESSVKQLYMLLQQEHSPLVSSSSASNDMSGACCQFKSPYGCVRRTSSLLRRQKVRRKPSSTCLAVTK